jgi:hypothetical protein
MTIVTAAHDRVTRGLRALPFSQRLTYVLIFWLLGIYPIILLLTWAIAGYLTFIETRQQRLDPLLTLWWLLLVFLTHFLGYLALRAWVFFRRHRSTA